MNIICVSAEYFRALYKESRGYSFRFQGYGSLTKTIDGLSKVNAADIYGFCVVATSLPEDKTLLQDFIRKCDILSSGSDIPKRIVFALNDPSDLESFLRSCGIKSLEPYLQEFDILTDQIIKQRIFGTILDGYLTPHAGNKSSQKIYQFSPLPTLRTQLPFHPELLQALSPVRLRDNLPDTFREDTILANLSRSSSFYKVFRSYFIAKHFGDGQPYLRELEAEIDKVQDKYIRTKHLLALDYIHHKLGSEPLARGQTNRL